MKVGFAWLLGCTGVLISTILPARADETRLIFGTTNAPQVPVNHRIFKPWVAKINDEAKGALVIDQRDGTIIANPINYYDRVVNDVVQISFGVQTYISKFEKSAVIGLPFFADNARQPSTAYWRLFKTGLLDSDYTEVVPLMLCSFAPTSVHFVRAPKTLDNLEGLKLIAGTKTSAQFLARLGAAPLTINLSEAYSALQRGAADGQIIAWAAFPAYKYDEVTFFHVPNAAVGTAPNSVFMNKKRYDALPEAARKAIDANRGEKESTALGAFWDTVGEEAKNYTKSKPNQTFVDLTPEQLTRWRHHAELGAVEWAKTVPDGERLLATFKDLLAKVKAEDLAGSNR
jgi:TRAP-type C4-dicarboxylate transport system substrate-binding protein